MDRFIEKQDQDRQTLQEGLKSNMDRFIDAPRDCLVLIDEMFKIQYG